MSGECSKCGWQDCFDQGCQNRKEMEWIKIDPLGECPKGPFFLSDEYGHVYTGSTPFDYYDAQFWFPIPKYPYLTRYENDPDSIIDVKAKEVLENKDGR